MNIGNLARPKMIVFSLLMRVWLVALSVFGAMFVLLLTLLTLILMFMLLKMVLVLIWLLLGLMMLVVVVSGIGLIRAKTSLFVLFLLCVRLSCL